MERNLSFTFREEARKVWEKREEQWEREKMARDRLMNEVMTFLNEVSLGLTKLLFQLRPSDLQRVTAFCT